MAGATPGGELAMMIEPVLGSMGYELVDIEFGSGGLLRVVIDIDGGTRHVQVEDCEKVSHQLGRLFMVENVDYERLEISSPGLDRPLKKPSDFERFAGEKVSLRLREPIDGRRQFTGVLLRGGEARGEVAGGDGGEGASPEAVKGSPGEPAGIAGGRAGVPGQWVLLWSDEPPPPPGRKGAKGSKSARGGKAGKSGKGAAKAAVAARSGAARDAGPEVPPQGQRLEFTLDQIEKARLVPKLVF
jgi:ribosome maturation factor RimP